MELAGTLLGEVIKRSHQCMATASPEVVKEIIDLSIEKAFIAVCGNSFIALLNQVFRRLDASQ